MPSPYWTGCIGAYGPQLEDHIVVLVKRGTPRLADIKAYAAEIGAEVRESDNVPAGQMYVMNMDSLERETNVWLSCIKE